MLIPIFQKGCAVAGCHIVGAKKPYLTSDVAYSQITGGGFVNVIEPTKSSIYLSTKAGGSMPTITPKESRALLDWIKNGAPNN